MCLVPVSIAFTILYSAGSTYINMFVEVVTSNARVVRLYPHTHKMRLCSSFSKFAFASIIHRTRYTSTFESSATGTLLQRIIVTASGIGPMQMASLSSVVGGLVKLSGLLCVSLMLSLLQPKLGLFVFFVRACVFASFRNCSIASNSIERRCAR